MACPACRHENAPGARFCAQCGSELAAACAFCGAALPESANFCPGCGRAMAADSNALAPRSARSYTPRHLAEAILRSRSALEGERKQLTVFFADVKGSMELAAGIDAEAWHRIMDRFFEILADGIHRFEGTINQFTGDGVMALFGAPVAHEDHAQRACHAALYLREELRGFSQALRREHGLDFAVRMGLNSGEVVVGRIGDDLRMDYTAKGQTVGLAARIEQIAEGGKVYVSEETARRVAGYFSLEDLGAFQLKGIAEPVPVVTESKMGKSGVTSPAISGVVTPSGSENSLISTCGW